MSLNVSPTLDILSGNEGTPTYHLIKLVQREMQTAGIKAITLFYIQLIVSIMTLLAIHGMDIKLDDSLREQIFNFWVVFELLGKSIRRQMKSDMPSLEFNQYDGRDSSRVARWGAMHARYPRVFEALRPGTLISAFKMQQAEVVFNAIEACRGLLHMVGAHPQLAIDTITDYSTDADKINPVYRTLVMLDGASPEMGGQRHPETGMRTPFWWKMIVTPVPEDLLDVIPAEFLDFPLTRLDDSMQSSQSSSSLDFDFDSELPWELHRWSMTSAGDGDEDADEETPKAMFVATMDAEPANRGFSDDAGGPRVAPSPAVRPLAIGSSTWAPGTPLCNAGLGLETPQAGPRTAEMTPRTATNRLREPVLERPESPKRDDSIQALIDRLIEEDDESGIVTSAKSFRSLARHENCPIDELQPGFVRITAERPTLVRVCRPARQARDSSASLDDWLKSFDSGAALDFDLPWPSDLQVARRVKLPVVEPLNVKAAAGSGTSTVVGSKKSKAGLLSRLNPLKRLLCRGRG